MKTTDHGSVKAVLGTIVLVAALSLGGGAARAATTIVVVGQTNGGTTTGVNQFNAASVTITAGDTVTWNSASDGRSHDVASHAESAPGTPLWQSPRLDSDTADTSYSRIFTTGGVVVTYYCSLHAKRAEADPSVIDANIAAGMMVGKIVVNAAAADTTAPTVSAVSAAPNPTAGAASVTLTATVADSGTPLGSIAAAEWSQGASGAAAGTGTAMSASDGAFSSASEGVTATVSVSGIAVDTTVTLWVRGRDAAGNWSAAVSTTLSVTGGTLSNTSYPIAFANATLTGLDLTLTAPLVTFRAVDARGTGAGWNVTVSAGDFTSATGGIAAANLKMRLQPSNIVKVAGNTPPASLVTTYQPLGLTPLKVLSAGAGQGMGTYDYTAEWQLVVPAQSFAGSYRGTVVVSINSGP